MSGVPARGPRCASRWAVAGIGLGCLVLVLLGAGVATGFGPQLRLDGAASRAFYAGDARPGWLEALLQVVTAPGSTAVRVVVFAPVVGWLVRRRAWRTAAWVSTAVLLVGPVTSGLKEAFGRVRPQFADGGARYTSLSYPSGHSSGIATLVVVALVLAWPLVADRRRGAVAVAGAALVVVVGLSRMVLGVHYLTDVLGGWALGLAWSLAVALAFDALPGGRGALPDRHAVRGTPR